MPELTHEQEVRLMALIHEHFPGKGWDIGSLVLGFAVACGLPYQEARRLSGERRYRIAARRTRE